MGKFIDTDILIEKAKHESEALSDISDFDILVEWLIDKTPTADVRENVHGEWLRHKEFQRVIACSICNCFVSQMTNFCPHCGANMRKVEE